MHPHKQLTRFRVSSKSWHSCCSATTLFPDFASCDFWLFPKLKMALKWKIFGYIDTIKGNKKKRLSSIPKISSKNISDNSGTAGISSQHQKEYIL
jgi:hypothetical protein